jgi:hypothetical protein
MKKHKPKLLIRFLLLFILTGFVKSYSQQYEINFSPEGKLESIYDNRGNQFKLKDILINAPKNSGVLTTTSLNCSTTSYFKLYLDNHLANSYYVVRINNESRITQQKLIKN